MKKNRYSVFLVALIVLIFGFTLFFLINSLGTKSEITTKVGNLTINYQKEPAGLEITEPFRFSWNISSNLIGQRQTAYQIEISDSDSGELIWTSGKVENEKSVGISHKVDGLVSENKYNWKVSIDTKDGHTVVSEPASFITATDMSEASWILPIQESGSAPLLRTEKKLKGKVKKAYLYMSALGNYAAYINGVEVKKVGVNDIFAPGWTDYKYYTNYQTYDVSEYIQGENVTLGVELGNGWYAGRIGEVGDYTAVIGDKETCELALIGKLLIKYEDGSKEVITTNDSEWLSSDYSPVLENDFFDGETYDANIEKEIKGWNESGYDVSDWKKVTEGTYKGELRSGSKAVVRMAEEYTLIPVSAFTYKDSETISSKEAGNDYGAIKRHAVEADDEILLKAGEKLIVDMGQNAAGVVEFTVNGPKDSVVTLVHAEMLNDGRKNINNDAGGSDNAEGSLYLKAIANAEVTDRYILSDENEQTFVPLHTYHGYRYVQFESTEEVTLKDIRGKVFTGVGVQTGTIVTNNENINQLVKNTDWSQMSNYLSIPTDCPQRGERAGWMGDAQLFAATGVYNYDVYAFLENYNEIMQENAKSNGNGYGSIIPASFVGFFRKLLPADGAMREL